MAEAEIDHNFCSSTILKWKGLWSENNCLTGENGKILAAFPISRCVILEAGSGQIKQMGAEAAANQSSGSSSHNGLNNAVGVPAHPNSRRLMAKMYRLNQILDYLDLENHIYSEAFWKAGLVPNQPKFCILLGKKFPERHSKLQLERVDKFALDIMNDSAKVYLQSLEPWIQPGCVGRGFVGYLGNKVSRIHFDKHANTLDESLLCVPSLNICRILWLGDLNYQIVLHYRLAKALIGMQNWRQLLKKDELQIKQRHGRVFDGWKERKISLPIHREGFVLLYQTSITRTPKNIKTGKSNSSHLFPTNHAVSAKGIQTTCQMYPVSTSHSKPGGSYFHMLGHPLCTSNKQEREQLSHIIPCSTFSKKKLRRLSVLESLRHVHSIFR
ncbi:Type I inositol 1,5-trisphosphate 5-phosphatase 1 [Striga asiatica]|uniref:Type I inositol 1,5-trisphosphate 5-phosphatase 1 n=1 Tax=Striga asiatica TaxID=4170 RepID=A0A5A7RG67_STRAF|nr:Type I inositol 1,5-trisphosphate 5-phosphatase 1 [Striga asiatica]